MIQQKVQTEREKRIAFHDGLAGVQKHLMETSILVFTAAKWEILHETSTRSFCAGARSNRQYTTSSMWNNDVA